MGVVEILIKEHENILKIADALERKCDNGRIAEA